jgi:hypothetical protein
VPEKSVHEGVVKTSACVIADGMGDADGGVHVTVAGEQAVEAGVGTSHSGNVGSRLVRKLHAFGYGVELKAA